MRPGDTARLGRTDLRVTRLGLGLAPIGGLYTPVSEEQALATIERAWQHGIRLFDTAPLYGYGRSEERTGRALRPRPRADYVLCTKVGRRLAHGSGNAETNIWADPPPGIAASWDFSYAGVLDGVKESRERLGVDRIDVLHLHDPEEHYVPAMDGGYVALDLLRESGEIGAVSVGTNRLDRIAEFVRDGRFDCLMIAGRYTLLDQSALSRILPLCTSRGISVLAAGVYNSGLLAATPDTSATFNYHPAPQHLVERARAIGSVCSKHDVPLRAAAIQFPLAHPAVTSIVVGARSPAEVDDAVEAFTLEIPPDLWQELKAEGMIPSHAPTPH